MMIRSFRVASHLVRQSQSLQLQLAARRCISSPAPQSPRVHVRLAASVMPITSAAAELYSRVLEEHEKWLAPAEMARMEVMQAIDRATFYASRKSVKIALAEAAGIDDPNQVDYRQIELVRNGPSSDMPAEDDAHTVDPRLQVRLSGRMQTALKGRPFVSLSHDADAAVGFACIETDADSDAAPLSTRHSSPFDLPSQLQLEGRVFGIGVDVAEIRRFGELYQRNGERFMQKALSPEEITFVQQQPSDHVASHLARRWSLKEALLKASGHRLLFPHMHLDSTNHLTLSGAVKEFFEREQLRPHYFIYRRSQMMYAFVVLETKAA
jgi:phosphopantetheine--protein transferase-like protein